MLVICTQATIQPHTTRIYHGQRQNSQCMRTLCRSQSVCRPETKFYTSRSFPVPGDCPGLNRNTRTLAIGLHNYGQCNARNGNEWVQNEWALFYCTLYIVHDTHFTVQYIMYIMQYRVYTVQFIMYTVYYTVYSIQCILYIHNIYIMSHVILFTLKFVHCTVYTVQSLLYIVYLLFI